MQNIYFLYPRGDHPKSPSIIAFFSSDSENTLVVCCMAFFLQFITLREGGGGRYQRNTSLDLLTSCILLAQKFLNFSVPIADWQHIYIYIYIYALSILSWLWIATSYIYQGELSNKISLQRCTLPPPPPSLPHWPGKHACLHMHVHA